MEDQHVAYVTNAVYTDWRGGRINMLFVYIGGHSVLKIPTITEVVHLSGSELKDN